MVGYPIIVFWNKEHKASQSTQVQNAVIRWLFKAKPPNHTFWNSHSVSIITDMLSGEQRTEPAFYVVPLSALPSTPQSYCLSFGILLSSQNPLGILLSTETTSSRARESDSLQDACIPPLGCRKAGIMALLQVKRNEDLRIKLPRWVCWPLGDCLHQDVPHSHRLAGWSMTKKAIFRQLPGQRSKAWETDTCLHFKAAQNTKSLRAHFYC